MPSSSGREPCGPPTKDSTTSFWHSEPSSLLLGHRSTRELPRTADVVIIGSGMTGASVAHHLLTDEGNKISSEGLNVVMLEAREACWGATGRNGGHCAPQLVQHPHELSIAHFELANYHTIQTLVRAKQIDCEFVSQPGVLALYDHASFTDAEMAISAMQETAPDLAKDVRLVTDPKELQRLRVPTAVGAAETSIAARMWPYKFVAHILEDLLTSTSLQGSFNLQTLTPVDEISAQQGDRWLVRTSRGSIQTSKLVLATNAYTSHLAPEFADLIVPCRGQMSALEPLPSVSGSQRLTTSFGFLSGSVDDYLVQRPNESGGHLMYGGGRQNGRSLGVIDDSVINEPTAQWLRSRLIETLDLPEGKKSDINDVCCEFCQSQQKWCNLSTATRPSCHRCRRFHRKCIPAPPPPRNLKEFTANHEWTGIMGYSRDEKPWVGHVPGKPNLYMAAGYTGHGMPNTWLCGKAVAVMVSNSSAEIGETVAVRGVGLPEAYLISEARIRRAMELEDVETRDWAEIARERARRRGRPDRPCSGYA